MLYMMRKKLNRGTRLRGGLAAFLLAGSGAALAANVTVELCASTGSVNLPAATSSINILGYVSGACPQTATVPGGPVIDVNVGDSVTVNLHNSLPVATGLLFQGQSMVPDTTGATAAVGATSGAKTYRFIATNPGTFLYEAALLPNAEHQTAMGLHGALIVRPAAVPFTGISVTPSATGSTSRTDAAATYTSGSKLVADAAILSTDLGAAVSGTGIPFGTTITAVTAGTSFSMSARAAAGYGASTVVNEEAVLVLSELDPELNNSADPATFDMRNYAPRYFLINGKAYPDTAPIASAVGNKVLLRYVNAGVKHHSMAVLGVRQNFVAKDASLLPTLNHNVAAETLAPGQTGDAIVTVPALTTASKFAVYDGSLALHNNGADNAFGGMLTFVTAGTGAAATAPTTNTVALTPNPTNGSANVALTASINSSASTVTAAEYFVDTPGTAGTGLAMSGAFGSATITVTTSLTTARLALLAPGNHAIYVHGKDASNKWGPFSSAVLNLDKAGPLTSGLTITPNTSGGTVSVALHATSNDSATGGSNITAAEYFRGVTPPVTTRGTPMTVNIAAPVASIDTNIPCSPATPCVAGAINVRSQDALGNWGAFATIALNVVAAGPVTSTVGATPNPNNGARALSSSQAVVRVTATMRSTGSTVSAAEGFIDTVGATGSGFPFVPSDGIWNGATEIGYADIPLATINALSAGNHTIYVHGKDATGNWGATADAILVIDKTPPMVSSINRVGTTPTNASNVGFLMTFSESINGGAAANFRLTTTSGMTGASIASVSAGPSTTRTVTVNTGTNSGTIRLDMANSTGVADLAGNAVTGLPFITGQSFTIDKTAPTFASVTLNPISINQGAGSVTITVNGSADSGGSGLANAGEYWFDTTTIPQGSGTAFTGTSGISIATGTLSVGSHTLRVRIHDNAGNWSTVRTATLTVTLVAPGVSKVFTGSVRGGNGTLTQRTTTLTMTLSNSNGAAITGVALADDLPQPVAGSFTVVASATTCGGTTSTQNTNRRLLLTGGSIPARGSCTVTATVRLSTNATNGSYTLTNTIPVGAVATTNAGSNQVLTSAVLTVNP